MLHTCDVFSHFSDSFQAEYVRIPHADHSLYHIPEGADEDAMVMLSDILPSGLEIGVIDGEVLLIESELESR